MVTIPPLTNPLIILLMQAMVVNMVRLSIRFNIPKLIAPKVQKIIFTYNNYFFPKKNIILP